MLYIKEPWSFIISSDPITTTSKDFFSQREKRKQRMAGIIHKIEETLHMGGNKKEEQLKAGEQHKTGEYHGEHKAGEYHGEHKAGEYGGDHKTGQQYQGEHKEGFTDKIKDKVHGGGSEDKDGKKKKKEKKKHEEGHKHGDSSSSSDSD
jgi:hypothetical protein